MNKQDAFMLTQMLTGEAAPEESGLHELSEMQISALKEISNILIGSYLSAISSLTGFTVNASVPELVIDMAGAIMNLLVSAYGEYGDGVLFMETEFVTAAQSIFGRFFLIPDVDSYNRLMAQMGLI
jgi:chemotaxis protein CheC